MISKKPIPNTLTTFYLLVYVCASALAIGLSYLSDSLRTTEASDPPEPEELVISIPTVVVPPAVKFDNDPTSETFREYYLRELVNTPEWANRQRSYWAERLHDRRILDETTTTTRAPAPTSTTTPTAAAPGVWRASVEQWRPLVTQYAGYYGGTQWQIEHLLGIIRCESVGDPKARNPRSGTMGLFQHRPLYWESRSTRAIGYVGDPWDPEVNIAVGVWLYFTGGSGHWEYCGVWSANRLG